MRSLACSISFNCVQVFKSMCKHVHNSHKLRCTPVKPPLLLSNMFFSKHEFYIHQKRILLWPKDAITLTNKLAIDSCCEMIDWITVFSGVSEEWRLVPDEGWTHKPEADTAVSSHPGHAHPATGNWSLHTYKWSLQVDQTQVTMLAIQTYV